MSDAGESPQRIAAGMHLAHAKAHMAKGKVERALEEAHLAIETDPDFADVRWFLADAHERLGETRKAVHQYEALLFHDPHNEDLLARIERLDPHTAEKHRRLADVAPDPFVAKGRLATGAEDDFVDMEAIDSPGASPAALEVIPEGPTELEDMADATATEEPQAGQPQLHVDKDVFEDEVVGAPAAAAVAPEQYAYEDERQVREAITALSEVAALLAKQRTIWREVEALDDLIKQTRPLTYTESEEAANAFFYAASILGVHTTVPCVVNDASLWPLVCGPMAAYVVIPASAFEALDATELYFLAGRTLARVASGHVPLLEVTAALLPPPRPTSRLLDLQRNAAAKTLCEAGSRGGQSAKLQQHLHTWRLRAELTADRAGLVCCQSIDHATSAIAKLTAGAPAAAQALSREALEQRFAGQDLGQIAAIGIDRDPTTSEPYAFYRIRMLQWWSTQPGYTQPTP
jgi:Tetratricopeptide repeat